MTPERTAPVVDDLLSLLDALSEKLAEAYRSYAFQWQLEKEAKASGIQQAWGQNLNASQTADLSFVQSLGEATKSVQISQEIKALEQEYAHVRFLIEHAQA